MSFFDFFGAMFDPEGGPGGPDRRRNEDDPVILHVQTDGEGPGQGGGGTSRFRFSGPGDPRLTSRRKGNEGPSRGSRILAVVVAVVLVVFLLLFALSRFITDVMWFSQLGAAQIVWTQLGIKVGLWLAYALLLAAVTLLSAILAIRSRPDSPDGSTIRVKGDLIEVGKGVSSRTALKVAVVVSLVVGVFFGFQFNADWKQVLLLFNAQSFGVRDPQFGLDNGFYVFILPGLQLLVSSLLMMLLAATVFSLVTNFLMGGIRLTMPVHGRGILEMTRSARRQVAVWLILFMLVWAGDTALGVFGRLTEEGDRITGASYTSVKAAIPVTLIMAVVIALLGIILAVWILRSPTLEPSRVHAGSLGSAVKQWRIPALAVAVTIVLSLLLTVFWPALVQRFRVNPNAQEMESAYIQRNIAATTKAYGLDRLKTEAYDATTEVQSGALSRDAETTAQIRLLDPQVVSPTFRQLQQSKQYYTFEDTLAVDKYDIDGVSQDTVIGARELDLEGNDNRNWVNDHTVFTHGYGIVAAYGNKVTPDGQPEFFEQDIPTKGKLTDSQHYEPRIYFSPNAPEYSIVGAPQGSSGWEFDYPTGSKGATNTFKGNGGPSVGNFLARVLYAIRFGSDQILFSDRVTPDSQILYNRSPKERVAQIAPYLTLDGRVYPAVVDGRVKWIVDGYTTSDAYPYSQKVFPGQFKPLSSISGDLMSHMRYPESLFKVQRQLLSQYHVNSASQFFSGEDFWQTPVDPTGTSKEQKAGIKQPPYYLTLQTPGTDKPAFSLTSTFIPAGTSTREILTGFLSVDSDAGSTKGVIGPDYGTIRLMELPKNSNVPGPGQAQNNFNSDAAVSTELNLLQSGSTKVKRGNLLTLPIGGGLIYIQPVYVQSSGATSFPLLKRVLVAFGDKVSSSATLDAALDKTFQGNSGASAGDADNTGRTNSNADQSEQSDKAPGKTAGSGGASTTGGQALKQALDKANQAMSDGDAALKKGDFSAYGEAQNRLREALKEASDQEGGNK